MENGKHGCVFKYLTRRVAPSELEVKWHYTQWEPFRCTERNGRSIEQTLRCFDPTMSGSNESEPQWTEAVNLELTVKAEAELHSSKNSIFSA